MIIDLNRASRPALLLARAFALLLVAAVVGGCSESGPTTYLVSGEVTFQDQPLPTGEIIFRAVDGAEGSWGAKIVDGRYELQSTPGAKRVEITAERQITTTAARSGEGTNNFQMYIPPKYNEQSELTVEVTASGANEFDFALSL